MRSLPDMMKPVCVFFPHFIGLAPPFFRLPLPSWTSLHGAKWPYLSSRLWPKKAFVRITLSISQQRTVKRLMQISMQVGIERKQ